MPHEVHAPRRHRHRQGVERPAHAWVERGEDGRDREHGRGMSGRKRVEVQHDVRPWPADEMLDRELHQAGGHERQRAQPCCLVEGRPPLGAPHEPDGRADQQRRDAAAKWIQGADDPVEHRVFPRRHGAGDGAIDRDGRGGNEENDAGDRECVLHETPAARRQKHHGQSIPTRVIRSRAPPRAAGGVIATTPRACPSTSRP